ncbi:hypothetical protein NKI72_25815 [Mesorhizobium sp. M0437]|uniref:hypothetical protein n=1 Tax=Mesorhizobium sp. M0437 TaxID=2956945 RepID=UPI00333BA569
MQELSEDPDEIRLFGEIREVFERYPNAAIDLQEEAINILQVVQALRGSKNVFLGMAEDEVRAGPYREVVRLAKDYGCLSGSGKVNVHHRYRPLKIDDARVAREVDSRSSAATSVFWLTRNEAIHEKFVAGDTSFLSDAQLLDYPQCCAAWHYDCYFARARDAYIRHSRYLFKSLGLGEQFPRR